MFNLTVEGEPEYFANGILVHNCDQTRYVCRWAESFSGTTGAIIDAANRHNYDATPFDDLPADVFRQ